MQLWSRSQPKNVAHSSVSSGHLFYRQYRQIGFALFLIYMFKSHAAMQFRRKNLHHLNLNEKLLSTSELIPMLYRTFVHSLCHRVCLKKRAGRGQFSAVAVASGKNTQWYRTRDLFMTEDSDCPHGVKTTLNSSI